ncbi:hypothetical protein DBR42_23310 [Pelomonas sp. HMWF004]|nr:hypothetical protein DBR42_23310 [Pelomonas sp. HMWF004]
MTSENCPPSRRHPASAGVLLATTGIVAAALLSACGGGGGGSGGGTGGTPQPTGCQVNSVASSGLIISEIATNFGSTSGPWLEVYNASSTAVDLAAYSLRSGTSDATGKMDASPSTLPLPSVSVAPGAYLVIAAKSTSVVNAVTAQGVVYLDAAGRFAHWQDSGFVELVKGGATQDAVRFGTSSAATSSECGWADANVAALPSSPNDFGRALVRRVGTMDRRSNSAADWSMAAFTTPGGPNDVPADAADADNDGIPDTAEVPGGHYAGLDLYAMGARAGRPDIFVQIDHMAPGTGEWAGWEAGWTPQRRALEIVTAAFARRGYAIHFDVGNALGDAAGTGYNLGAGSQVPFSECIYFDATRPASGCSYAFQHKVLTMPANRRNVFHYVLLAVNHSEGANGQAELGGNDVVLTQGFQLRGWSNSTYLGNIQGLGLMHELGHNLGLRHGGFEDRNYKPNYYSIMNYLYQGGLAVNPKGEGPMQRWYGARGVRQYPLDAVINSPINTDFFIDYSDGSGSVLDGRSLLESELIGRGADPGVFADWNANGILDVGRYGVSTALNSIPAFGYLDPEGAQPMRDYNDWGNLQLTFARRITGTSTILSVGSADRNKRGAMIDSLVDDRQPSIVELPSTPDGSSAGSINRSAQQSHSHHE